MPFSIISSSIERHPILHELAQTAFELKRTPISGFQRMEILLETDYLTSGAIPNLTVSVKPALFLTPAGGAGTPANKGFDFNIPAGTALLTVINGVFSGNERERNFNAKLTLGSVGANYQLEIAFEFQNTADLKSYITSSAITFDVGRLLRNTNGAPIDLTNTTTSAYNSVGRAGFDCYITEIINLFTVNQFVSFDWQNKFYDLINLPIRNNGVIQTNLFAFQPNLIEIEYTYAALVAAFTAYNPVVFLIKTSPVQNNINLIYPTGTELCAKQIFGAGNTPYPNDPLYWTGFNQNDKILAAGGSNWIPVAPPVYKFQFQIDETLLSVGEKYRIVLLAQFQDPGGAQDCYHYAVVSNQLTVQDTKTVAIPTATGSLEIYFDAYAADGIQVSPENRIRDNSILDGLTYNAVRGAGEFGKRLSSVTVKLYYDETVGATDFRHYQTILAINKNSSNLFTPSGGLQAVLDIAAQTLTCRYDHRLRYEPNLPNIQTFNITNPATPQSVIPASGNMDMTGKTIYVLWEFRFENDTDIEVFQYYKTLEVDFYDTTTLTFEAQDGFGNPIKQLCSDIQEICVKSTGAGTSRAIALLDKTVYGIANIKEYDGGAAGAGVTLPQLQQAPIISSQPLFVANDHLACIDATELDLLRKYRYGIIYKPSVPVPDCVYATDLTDPDYLAYVARTGAPLTLLRQLILSWFFVEMKAQGIFSKFDCLYLFANSNEVLARQNLIQNNFNCVPFNGISADFIVDRGYDKPAFGVGKFLQTNFKPATDGIQYNAGGSHFSVISGNNYQPMGFLEGIPLFVPYHLLIQNDGTNPVVLDGGIYPTDATSYANPSSVLTTTTRLGNDRFTYRNGDFQNSKTYGVSLATGCVIIHGYNVTSSLCGPGVVNDINAGGYTSSCSPVSFENNIPVASLGGYMTQAQVRAYHCIIRCYLLAIGFEYTNPCVGFNGWDDSTYC